jgi:hypothetical protein
VLRRYWPEKRNWSTISAKAIVTVKNVHRMIAHSRLGRNGVQQASPG